MRRGWCKIWDVARTEGEGEGQGNDDKRKRTGIRFRRDVLWRSDEDGLAFVHYRIKQLVQHRRTAIPCLAVSLATAHLFSEW